MVDGALLTTAFVTGLVGSTHCAGMCGGLVASLAWQPRAAFGAIAIRPVVALPAAGRQLAFNAGRVATYALLGALAGGVSAAGLALGGAYPVREALFICAQILTILLGIHLTGMLQPLAVLERGGTVLWRRVQPIAARLLPADTPARAFLLGGAWGWLPCGMIYSVLATAMTAGSAADGALVMLAFGSGTVPMLLMLGTAAERARSLLKTRQARVLAGCLVIAFGATGLARVPSHGAWSALVSLCQNLGVAGTAP